jgi:hypothetical protein
MFHIICFTERDTLEKKFALIRNKLILENITEKLTIEIITLSYKMYQDFFLILFRIYLLVIETPER